jgi:S-methyl-5-thioribose-1-phosphate isomerase
MAVRGAPAIAIASVLSVAAHALLRQAEQPFADRAELATFLHQALASIAAARPTAVNLPKACDMFRAQIDLFNEAHPTSPPSELLDFFVAQAEKFFADDVKANKALGSYGAAALTARLPSRDRLKILTHCNTGSLATAGHGTALGVIRTLFETQKLEHVYLTETRPYNQGSRLTAFEVVTEQLPGTLICDSMVGIAMDRHKIDAVIVGADRVAANGDTANKVGTYSIAVLAAYHKIPFYIAAPVTTLDPSTPCGQDIVIEERHAHEVRMVGPTQLAPSDIAVWNPAFDVAPASLIAAIITDRGCIFPGPGGSFDIPAFCRSL